MVCFFLPRFSGALNWGTYLTVFMTLKQMVEYWGRVKWSDEMNQHPILDMRSSVICPSVRTLLRSCYPHWNLKRGGLESSGQTKILSIGQTQIIALFSWHFFCFVFWKGYFCVTDGRKSCVLFRIWGLCLSVAGPCPTVAIWPYTSNKGGTHRDHSRGERKERKEEIWRQERSSKMRRAGRYYRGGAIEIK